ncbi:hypothetical protein MNBD_CHLOROFLEXI01-1550 [hydrothermal vent metagenome]|uniref:Peptidase M14 domain-containing protein n=1 Tax=hydrothermal vent metagenome TaxID=652676 RepID=A0A3B0UNU1_9ZZZZ
MGLKKVYWLLFCSLWLVGCAITSAENLPAEIAPLLITAVSTTEIPFSNSIVLPATQSALAPPATRTAVFSQPPIKPTAPTVIPSVQPTFAAFGTTQTIGMSVEQRPIISHRFGYGSQTIVLVGGMHGGYEWNGIILAYEMIDYFTANPDAIPANVSLYIIPSANPDGQFVVTGIDGRFTSQNVAANIELGRFNAHQVDLNRNWDCEWQAEALWGSTSVSGGSNPFSEPETAALATFFLRESPEVVLFWHSKANSIFVGGCGDTYPPSLADAEIYGRTSGYPVYETFTAYPVSGDASDWLATQNISSFTVELKTRSQTDWSQNLVGVLALLAHYGR